MRGRTDLEQYGDAAAQIVNFTVLPGGGLTRRSGSALVTKTFEQVLQVRLLPFLVSDQVAYVIELGGGYMRFMRNRGPVLDATGTPLQIATPYQATELRDVRFAQSADVMYFTHANYPPAKLSRTAAAVFTYQIVDFNDGPYDTENTGDVGANGAVAPVSTSAGTPPAASGAPRVTPGGLIYPNGTPSPTDPGGDGQGGRVPILNAVQFSV